MHTNPIKQIPGKYLLCLVVFGASLIGSPNIYAAPPAKPKPQAKPQPQSGDTAAFMAKYDLDKNKILNVDESRMIQEAYRDKPQDPMLKKYDTNNDGKLSDEEIMKISPPKTPPAKQKPAKPAPAKPKNGKK